MLCGPVRQYPAVCSPSIPTRTRYCLISIIARFSDRILSPPAVGSLTGVTELGSGETGRAAQVAFG